MAHKSWVPGEITPGNTGTAKEHLRRLDVKDQRHRVQPDPLTKQTAASYGKIIGKSENHGKSPNSMEVLMGKSSR